MSVGCVAVCAGRVVFVAVGIGAWGLCDMWFVNVTYLQACE